MVLHDAGVGDRGAMKPIRLRGPVDVLAALPYQLGYHPQDSLVVVALHGRRVGLVERLDLPPREHVAAAARSLVGPLLREAPDATLLVAYESAPGAAIPLLDALGRDLAASGVDVHDRLVVRDGRWYSLDCREGCCPSEGAPLPDPADTPAVADFIGLEVSPLPGRDSLASLVAPDESWGRGVRRALARRATPSWPGQALGLPRPVPGDADHDRALAVRRLEWLSLWAVVADVGDGGGEQGRPVESLTTVQVAELTRSLTDLELRDGLIAWWCPGSLPLDLLGADLVDGMRTSLPEPLQRSRRGDRAAVVGGRRLLARLQWLSRAVPDPDAAPVLSVLANLAWWCGDGALARVALDRALEHSPDYRLARLLEHLVDLGVRPGRGQEPAVSA